MKAYELAVLLEEYSPDADIFVLGDDEQLHDFKVEHRAEVFDGFDTAYEAGINIVTTD